MKIELEIDKNINEPVVKIHTNELNSEIKQLINIIEQYDNNEKIIGYIDDKAFILNKNEIESIYAEDNKVYAIIDNKKYRIKKKLYELEEMLNGTSFVRISNSEIANFNKVESMDIKGSTLIILKYKSGEVTYVSRRNVHKIKEYLNI